MMRWMLSLLFVPLSVVAATAHFVFVVPEPDGHTAKVILSEDLKPNDEVDVNLVGRAMLSVRDEKGLETAVALTKADHGFLVSLGSGGTRVVHGDVDFGVMAPANTAYVLLYHPKTIVGDAFDARTTLGGKTPVEMVVVGRVGALRLQLLAQGKPRSDAEITVIMPDGSQKAIKTDATGQTDVLAQYGQYGAWARYWEPAKGERGGKTYEQIRHYATLVFDAGTASPPSVATAAPQAGDRSARLFATLPQATSSFGAVVSDGWLYVYGGHIAPTHSYSTAAISGRFSRLNLSDGKTWESLPDGPPLQGMNLAAHGGKIYRIGGMQPSNRPGESEDVRSLADAARFDPKTKRWETLPPLPAPRSSHDVVIVGDKLFVVGGWALKGKDRTEWPESMDVLNLAAASLKWTSVPQPFKRRALIAAALDGRIYAIGGFDEHSRVVHGMDIYDVQRGTWSPGTDLPGGAMNGFGPAACTLDGDLYVSVDDGGLYRLDAVAKTWDKVGSATPRIVHRLATIGRQVLVIGGARKGINSDLIEAIRISR